MTSVEMGGLLNAVKRSHWDPVRGVAMFLRRHPSVELTPSDYGYAVCTGRIPFPSIKGLKEGPFPVYVDRPWYDYRLWHTEEQRAWEAELAAL